MPNGHIASGEDAGTDMHTLCVCTGGGRGKIASPPGSDRLQTRGHGQLILHRTFDLKVLVCRAGWGRCPTEPISPIQRAIWIANMLKGKGGGRRAGCPWSLELSVELIRVKFRVTNKG